MKNGTVLPRRSKARQSGRIALEFKKEEVFQCKGLRHCLENEAKKRVREKVAARKKKLKLTKAAVEALRRHSKTKHHNEDWF